MRRGLKIALIAWVGALLVAPIVGYALGFRGHAIENRALTAAPPLSLGTLLHPSAWHQGANAFSDHLPLRDRVIRWRAEVGFNVFSDSPNPGVVIVGQNHWLFLHEEFDVCTAWPTVQPLLVAQAFELAYAAAKASGRELRTLIVPAKSTIEAGHYRSSQYSFEDCARAREKRLERLLRGQPGVVDLWSAFASARRAGVDLWIPNDSHTDTAGSIVIARALVKSLRPSAWQEGVEQSGSAYPYVGDLSTLAGIRISATRHRLVLHGRPRDPIRVPLLALIDSQLEVSDPEILPFLPARQELGIDGLVVPPAAIRPARILVVETVLRTAYARVGFGFPAPLVDALLPDIRQVPASYGSANPATSSAFSVTTVPATVPVRIAHDDSHSWRLVVITVRQAAAPISLSLVDPRDQPLATPLATRPSLPAGARIALAIPPGVAGRDVRISVVAPAGATLSPPMVATLPTAGP
jgi:hypothetical protein